MLITCPACASVYDVPRERMAPGTSVRCARCGERWRQAESPDGALPMPPALGAVGVAAPASTPEPVPQGVLKPLPKDAGIGGRQDGSGQMGAGPANVAQQLPAAGLVPVAGPDAKPDADRDRGPDAAMAGALALSARGEEGRLLVPAAGPPRGGPGLAAAWAGSLALLSAILAGLVIGHAAIAHAWPPMQRLYGLLGLH